jgi:peptide/nickel transport system substrate-binding protein
MMRRNKAQIVSKGDEAMKRLLWLSLMIILITALVLGGCSKTAPSTTSAAKTTSAAASQPQYGGVLKIIDTQTISNLGYPGMAFVPADGICARPAIENLVGYDEKDLGRVVPQLATGWQISPDFTSITFTLRKGVKFQDGTDFNAAAAKYNLDAIREGNLPGLKSVKSVDVIDDYTIRLNLSQYEPQFLTSLSQDRLGIMVSPTALKALGKQALLHPVGTGPYKFVSYQTDTSLKYERFDGYWQGKPYLDGIEFVFIKDPVTAITSFRAGEAQAIRNIGLKEASDLKSAGYDVVPWSVIISGLAIDSAHSDSIFSDIRVRQAVAYALDKESIAKVTGYGFTPAVNQFGYPKSNMYNPTIAGYAYDPQKAKELLTAAGHPNGFDTTILFTQLFVETPAMFTMVQANLSNVGIKVKLDMAEGSRFYATAAGGWSNSMVHFNITCAGEMDPVVALKARLSSDAQRFNPKSIYRPPEYDSKLNQAATERDPDKRKALILELSKMIIDDYCMAIPIKVESNILSNSNQVHSLTINQIAGNEWLPEDAWLSK